MGPRQATEKKKIILGNHDLNLKLSIKLLHTNQETSKNLRAVQVFFNVRRQSGIPIQKSVRNLW